MRLLALPPLRVPPMPELVAPVPLLDWRRRAPFIGLRVAPQIRAGWLLGGYAGLAASWRHPLQRLTVPSATGRAVPVNQDVLGLGFFLGGDLAW